MALPHRKRYGLGVLAVVGGVVWWMWENKVEAAALAAAIGLMFSPGYEYFFK